MRKRRWLIPVGAVLIAAFASAAWYLASPLFLTQTVAEGMPQGGVLLAQGGFVDGETFHKGHGMAGIYRLSDGVQVLRFENFQVTNGPDLHVLLSANPEPRDKDGLGSFVDLGSLKGNMGEQNYLLPADFSPAVYRSVVVFCKPFQVVFSAARLERS